MPKSICLGAFPDVKLVLRSGNIVWCHRLFLSRFEYFKVFLLSKPNVWKACTRKEMRHGNEITQIDHFIEYDCSLFDVDEEVMVDLIRFTYTKDISRLQFSGLSNANEYAHAVSFLGLNKSFVKVILDLILKPVLLYAKSNIMPDPLIDPLLVSLITHFSIVHPDLITILYPLISDDIKPKVVLAHDLGNYLNGFHFQNITRKLFQEERKIGFQLCFDLAQLCDAKSYERERGASYLLMHHQTYSSRMKAVLGPLCKETEFETYVDKFRVKFFLNVVFTTKDEKYPCCKLLDISTSYISTTSKRDRPFGYKEFEFELHIFHPVKYIHITKQGYISNGRGEMESLRWLDLREKWEDDISLLGDHHLDLIREFNDTDMIIVMFKIHHHVPEIPQ